MRLNRREILTGIGSASVATLGALTLTGSSQATSIDIQTLEIANSTNSVSSPVTKAQLNVQGEYTVNAEKVPDRVVCRLEGKRGTSTEWTQLSASEPSTTLSKDFTAPVDYTANLLDLPKVTAPDLTPSAVGETTSMDIDVRLGLTVRAGGRTLEEVTTEDSARLSVEKTTAEVKIGMDVNGTMNVSD